MKEKVDLKLYESSNGGKKYGTLKELNEYLLNNNPHFHSKNEQNVPNGSHEVKKKALEAGIFKNRSDLKKILSKAKKKPIFSKNWQSLATDGKKKEPLGV